MAKNETRSMNTNLSEGLTDGSYKKFLSNQRGGVTDEKVESRADLHAGQGGYNMDETMTKVRPDGELYRNTETRRGV